MSHLVSLPILFNRVAISLLPHGVGLMKVLKIIEECIMAAILVPTVIGVVLCILILATLAAALAAALTANAIIILR